MQFLDPTNDYSFRKIFGNEQKKGILISFLNSILGWSGEETITDVTLLNPNQVPHIKGAKETLLDVRCHDQSGKEYIVEMQVIKKKYFDKRVQYYASKAYSTQLAEGEDYGRLNPVIFLGVLDFDFTANSHYLSTHRTCDVETQEKIFCDFQFTLIELPKFKKTEQQLETVADKWLYFLKHASELQAVPEVIHEQALKEAFEVVNRINWSQEEMNAYEERIKAWRDRAAEIESGYDKGLKKGLKEGRDVEKISVAQKMLSEGVDLELVAKCTGLSEKELLELRPIEQR